MNDAFKNLMNSIGILCELWVMSYEKFVKIGFSDEDALRHTKEFVSVLISDNKKGM